jgi:hypothetical protein
MKAARTRFLTLVTATCSLAEAGTDTAANATLCVLRAFCRLEVIQIHIQLLDPWSAA